VKKSTENFLTISGERKHEEKLEEQDYYFLNVPEVPSGARSLYLKESIPTRQRPTLKMEFWKFAYPKPRK
jgi:hypothetical protein